MQQIVTCFRIYNGGTHYFKHFRRLDVFRGEPEVHSGYFELPNVFMLPHVGSSTIEARRRMGRILIEALETWAAGGHPANRVV